VRRSIHTTCSFCGDPCLATDDDNSPTCDDCTDILEVMSLIRDVEDGLIKWPFEKEAA
jgi:hypothetical protein